MTFKDYPQRQKAASFNLDEVMEKLKESHGKYGLFTPMSTLLRPALLWSVAARFKRSTGSVPMRAREGRHVDLRSHDVL